MVPFWHPMLTLKPSAAPPINLVNSDFNLGNNDNTFTISFTPTQGNILVVSLGVNNTTRTITGITLTNVTWTDITGTSGGIGPGATDIWVGAVGASPGTSLEVAVSGGGANIVTVSEFENVTDTTDITDVEGSGSPTTDVDITGGGNSSNAPQLFYAAFIHSDAQTLTIDTAGWAAILSSETIAGGRGFTDMWKESTAVETTSLETTPGAGTGYHGSLVTFED